MKKKILIFSAPFFPRKSGVGDYVLRLSRKFVATGHEVIVFAYDTEETGKYDEILDKIKVLRVKSKKLLGVYFWPDKKHLKSQLEKLNKSQIDVVLTNTRFFHTSVVGMNFAKINNLPWIHVEHGSTFVQTNNPIIWVFSRLFDITLGRKILNNADRIVAISSGVKQFVKSLSSNKNIDYIPNGIELKNLPKKKLSKEVKNLVFVGRLIHGKGVQDLIRSISSMDKNDLKLTIVGDGPNRKDLEKLTRKLNLRNKVTFVGEKKREEALKCLAEADLFINPSHSEGLPTTVLEAGAIGTPVIATDVGGTKDVIINKKTGLLVKARDIDELKKAIEFMIRNKPLREKYSFNLQSHIRKNFDWEEIVKTWEEKMKKIEL